MDTGMNLKLINHKDYWLLVDTEAECPKGAWAIFPNTRNGELRDFEGCNPILCKSDYAANGVYNLYIIAHLPKHKDAPVLEGVLLMPDLPKQEEGIKEIAEQYAQESLYPNIVRPVMWKFLQDSRVKAATKRWSDEDLKTILEKFHKMNMAYLTGKEDDNLNIPEFLQSLSPVTLPVGFEPDILPYHSQDGRQLLGRFMTIKNEAGQEVLQGEWIHE